MKRNLLIAALVIIAGVVINYSLGGFDEIKPELVEVNNYLIAGQPYRGSYKSQTLTHLVDSLREQQTKHPGSKLLIVNYKNEANEAIGLVDNFVGLSYKEAVSISNRAEKRIIEAQKAIRLVVNIRPMIMPTPVKLDKIAHEFAQQQGLELQGMSIEQYSHNATLIVDYPVRLPLSKEEKLIKHIADRYGLAHFNANKTFYYTFNVQKGEIQVSRSWQWHPASGQVTLIEKEDTLQFNHRTLQKGQEIADHKFINDKYWLLFPFQLAWDTGFNATLQQEAQAPLSKQTTQKLTIVYNTTDGYTPGDAYDFYITKDFTILEWSFRKGNTPKPSLSTTWQDEIDLEGLKIATNHLSADGSFRLWFTGIKIE